MIESDHMVNTFNDVLSMAGVDPAEVKILRHGQLHWTKPYEAWKYDRPAFDGYQSRQGSRGAIPPSGYVASFAINRSGKTIFVGLYEIRGWSPCPVGSYDPITHEVYDDPDAGGRVYELVHDDRLADYEDRLVIEWPAGSAGRSWHRNASSTEWRVLEVVDQDEPMPLEWRTPESPAVLDNAEVESLANELTARGPAGQGFASDPAAIERVGMRAVADYFEGWDVRDVSTKKKGWDLEARRDGVTWLVEVKATATLVPTVWITPNEWRKAQEYPEWVLAIVTDALGDMPRLTWFMAKDLVMACEPSMFLATMDPSRGWAKPMSHLVGDRPRGRQET